MNKPSPPRSGARRVKSVHKTISILRALAAFAEPVRLSVLARHLGMAPNLLRAYLVDLCELDMVRQHQVTGHYDLGHGAISLGMAALRRSDLMEAGRPSVEALTEQLGTPVTLAIWGDRGPVAIHSAGWQRHFPYEIKVGATISATNTAGGRCFLAYLPFEQWQELLERERHELGPLFPGLEILEERLAEIRDQGIACRVDVVANREDAKPVEIRVLAAPIFDALAQLAAVLVVISQDSLFDVTPGGERALAVKQTAAAISRELGYTGSAPGDFSNKTAGLA